MKCHPQQSQKEFDYIVPNVRDETEVAVPVWWCERRYTVGRPQVHKQQKSVKWVGYGGWGFTNSTFSVGVSDSNEIGDLSAAKTTGKLVEVRVKKAEITVISLSYQIERETRTLL